MTFTLTHPDVPAFRLVSRLRAAIAARQAHARARYIARRAHALWVSERLAEVDVSTLDRLDRWLAS